MSITYYIGILLAKTRSKRLVRLWVKAWQGVRYVNMKIRQGFAFIEEMLK
jgi:hypothetical protein